MVEMNGIEYLTITEAHERVGLSTARLRALLYEGKIEGLKVGHQNFVTVASVDAYAASERKAGAPRKRNDAAD